MHYTGTIWRPPYEAYSLLIQVTAGCTHHSCKFCTLYEDLPFKFRMSPLEEVKSDLKEANHYYKDADRVFFTGANPFVLSVDKLKILAKMVHEYFPNCQSIGCFARITDVSQKSVKDLQELKDLGYDGITFGIETGDDEALVFMKKGYLSKDIIEQCKKLEEVDMSYNFFYLTGISGSGRGEIGAKATAEIFNQLHPQIIDASMLTIYPTSQLFQEIQAGNWKEETEIEKLQELKTLIQNLTVNARFATDGASNLIQVRGNLKTDKQKMVHFLEQQIHVITVKQVLIPCLKFFGCIYLPESFYFFCVQIRIGHLHTDLFDRLFCELLYGPFSFCRLLCKLFGQLLCRLFLFLLLQIHPGIAHSLRAVDFYRFFKLADICIDSFDLINVNLILLRKDSICPSLCQNTHILIFCFIFQ